MLLFSIKNNFGRNSGFTLVELLIVVLIIGILVAIAVPSFTSQVSESSDTAAKANIRTAVSDVLAAYTLNGDIKPPSGYYGGTYWDADANTLQSTVENRVCTASYNPVSSSVFSDGSINCTTTP